MTIHLNPEEFIKIYREAVDKDWTLEQLADCLGTRKISTLYRKTSRYNLLYGCELPRLRRDPNHIRQYTTEEGLHLVKRDSSKKELPPNFVKKPTKFVHNKRYVITSAQNATPIHEKFFKSILNYCKAMDADLMVIPYRYKNPTSLWTEKNADDDWWSPVIIPYLVDKVVKLNNNISVLGSIKIQPTTSSPCNGLETFSGTSSCVIGHPKIQFRSVPSSSKYPKIITSTGSLTIPNYTDSKAGMKGEFYHSISATIIEVINDEEFHLRHIHADSDTGEFYDLDKHFNGDTFITGERISGLICGDVHAEFIDKDVEHCTFHANNSIANLLNPKVFVFHDLTDFYARNHHSVYNDILNVGKHIYNKHNNVEEGLQEAANFIDRVSRKDTKNIIVKSNHDEAFDRWLREADGRKDWENARFYYYMKYYQMKNIVQHNMGFSSIDPFEFWCTQPDQQNGLKSIKNTVFLKRDESYRLHDIELGHHGDAGINGSRGSIKSYTKLSSKSVIGHSHSPGIEEGVYQVGVCTQRLDYAKGPSTWMQSHCIIYPDGKRTLIHIINGKWKM